MADKKTYRDVSDLRWQKLKSEIGWWVLIAGIVVEIATACVVAVSGDIEMKQIKINEAKNNPLNQPISDVSANVNIKLAGTNFTESPLWGAAAVASLILDDMKVWSGGTNVISGATTIEMGNLLADKDDVRRVDYSELLSPRADTHGYVLHFHPNNGLVPFVPVFRITPQKAKLIIDAVRVLVIAVKFIPHDAELLGGDAEILINGNIRVDFDILPQKAFPLPVGLSAKAGDSGFTLIATNATLKILPTWMR